MHEIGHYAEWPALHNSQPIAHYYWPEGEVSTSYYAAMFLRRGAGLDAHIIVTVPGV